MAAIRDVAKMCGVLTSTVSNVLNARSEGMSDTTKRTVLRAVRTLRYRPTPLQHSQKKIFARNLALVCGDLSASPILSTHYLGRVFEFVLEAAAFQSWSVTTFGERMWAEATAPRGAATTAVATNSSHGRQNEMPALYRTRWSAASQSCRLGRRLNCQASPPSVSRARKRGSNSRTIGLHSSHSYQWR